MASDILIVDDEADIRELVAGLLEDEGHETLSEYMKAARRYRDIIPLHAHQGQSVTPPLPFRP